ncbi:hypothetical protein KS4_12760 [Poriferisphaera corsica]|uniref:Uncharacterized protein n=1 Tax=Poriferisphaera corsica TaxID=2528020 RepID=A0A517YSP2_9BACT|nr:hypothetical protein KS4_12760 [Poriferisphaera corsica]
MKHVVTHVLSYSYYKFHPLDPVKSLNTKRLSVVIG